MSSVVTYEHVYVSSSVRMKFNEGDIGGRVPSRIHVQVRHGHVSQSPPTGNGTYHTPTTRAVPVTPDLDFGRRRPHPLFFFSYREWIIKELLSHACMPMHALVPAGKQTNFFVLCKIKFIVAAIYIFANTQIKSPPADNLDGSCRLLLSFHRARRFFWWISGPEVVVGIILLQLSI